jgi:hypothetical protein
MAVGLTQARAYVILVIAAEQHEEVAFRDDELVKDAESPAQAEKAP